MTWRRLRWCASSLPTSRLTLTTLRRSGLPAWCSSTSDRHPVDWSFTLRNVQGGNVRVLRNKPDQVPARSSGRWDEPPSRCRASIVP